MPAGGGTSQTAVNRHAGARTQLAEVVTAGATLATMFFLAPYIGLMPQATLAAVVVVYSIGLIKPVEFRSILRIRRTEFVWALAAFAGVMLFGAGERRVRSIDVVVADPTSNPGLCLAVKRRAADRHQLALAHDREPWMTVVDHRLPPIMAQRSKAFDKKSRSTTS